MTRSTSRLSDARLVAALGDDAAARLEELVSEISAEPTRIRVLMPAAARRVARGAWAADDPRGLLGPTLDDAVRGELLVALARATERDQGVRKREVAALYRYGDADEKRAVLRALHRLDLRGEATDLLSDALRTNDPRLVAAALGPYAAEHLGDEAWRHGVLKCLFLGIPVAAVVGLDARADTELSRMVTSYAEECRAAGRTVPEDVDRVLAASATVSKEN